MATFGPADGWKLGEHGGWSKCSNWELDSRVPLLIRAPWIGASIGVRTAALAELVDVYPTAVALAGLPPVPTTEGIEGVSLLPVLMAPDLPAPHNKTAAFSQFSRCTQFSMWTRPQDWECLYIPRENFTHMGYSLRVANWRYTEWRLWIGTKLTANWSEAGLRAVEMYDHSGDTGLGPATFDDFENINLAYDSAYSSQRTHLSNMLREHFDREHLAATAATATNPYADETYPVFWAVQGPNASAFRANGSVDIAQYGMKTNNFTICGGMMGDIMPAISADGTIIRGGVPQSANFSLDSFLSGLSKAVEARIPDPDYAGLAVFDFEAFTPIWSEDTGAAGWHSKKYRVYSIKLVQQAHPSWSSAQVEALAIQDFERAAIQLFVAALQRGKALRPRALWGFYGMPIVQ
eukprot:SAG25_NODE_62_length_17948_cov_8.453975_17_plen_406_part_00